MTATATLSTAGCSKPTLALPAALFASSLTTAEAPTATEVPITTALAAAGSASCSVLAALTAALRANAAPGVVNFLRDYTEKSNDPTTSLP